MARETQLTRALVCEIGASVAGKQAPHLRDAFLKGDFKLAAEGMAGMEGEGRKKFVKAFLGEGKKRLNVKGKQHICDDTLRVLPFLEGKPGMPAKVLQALLEIAGRDGIVVLGNAARTLNLYRVDREMLGLEVENWLAYAVDGKLKWPRQLDPETMITGDYLNEFYGWQLAARRTLADGEPVEEKVRTYEERYEARRYTDLVNDTNRERVKKLDALVRRINATPAAELSEQVIEGVIDEALGLIFGKKALGIRGK